jgi:GDPmannose 4,6-dehydratase
MFVVNSLLFNHESSRRGGTFVTKKITDYVGKYYKNNSIEPLNLGNLNSRRDWGSAKIYMQGVYLMLQQEKPQNYVLATGETHSVREFVELAFKEIGVEIVWRGTGVDEVGIKKGTENDIEPHIIVKVNPKYYRDIDIECLIGDSSKAKRDLGWTYDLSFEDLVKEMVTESIKRA